ncbi:hypothetical protein FB565_003309 [Actinoplanes lutulentus]|uniref:Uncharacterized protein n=1 Tax=Actinoplanes lutulentus TaxID=1287878 RepID=A0A327YZU2_9ACTN|nr:hypothetical protein [Actinoplanes lutulentus]MBB2943580.1 hypothetical protein [Actinoplanes lutulentus]RAK27446.1 hypothetical protein B0I29_12380 [Actinoplanes lutulentus]
MARMTPLDRPVTDDDRYWQQQAQQYRRGALERTRAAALAWTTTLTAVTGFFGVVTFFKGPEDLTTIPAWARATVGVLALLALVAVLAAVAYGTLAAQGRIEATWTTPDAIAARTEVERRSSVHRLRFSRWLALIALILLIGAVGTAWYAPRQAKSLLVTWTDGRTLCVPADTKSFAPQLPAEQIKSLRTVAKCP